MKKRFKRTSGLTDMSLDGKGGSSLDIRGKNISLNPDAFKPTEADERGFSLEDGDQPPDDDDPEELVLGEREASRSEEELEEDFPPDEER